jgi:hypothetical protein
VNIFDAMNSGNNAAALQHFRAPPMATIRMPLLNLSQLEAVVPMTRNSVDLENLSYQALIALNTPQA